MSVTPQFKTIIENHLNEVAAKDPLFAETLKKPNKNIDECTNYILKEVQKSGKAGFADSEIYNMAIHYYDEDEIKDVPAVKAKVIVNQLIESKSYAVGPKTQKKKQINPVQQILMPM